MVTRAKKKVTKKKATKKKVAKKVSPETKKRGRPTKYDPAFCEIVIEEMAKGYSKEAVAGVLEISKQRLYDWAEKYPDFRDAISIGESKSRRHWENKLVDYAVHTKNGKQINGQVFNLNMKNRFGWSDKKEVEVANKNDESFNFSFDLSKKPSHRE